VAGLFAAAGVAKVAESTNVTSDRMVNILDVSTPEMDIPKIDTEALHHIDDSLADALDFKGVDLATGEDESVHVILDVTDVDVDVGDELQVKVATPSSSSSVAWPNDEKEFHYYFNGAFHSLPGEVVSVNVELDQHFLDIDSPYFDGVSKKIPTFEEVTIKGTSWVGFPEIGFQKYARSIPGCVEFDVEEGSNRVTTMYAGKPILVRWEIHPQQNREGQWGYYQEIEAPSGMMNLQFTTTNEGA
jgi:hypothetical protein